MAECRVRLKAGHRLMVCGLAKAEERRRVQAEAGHA
jgi:hypothetical protein